jgi:hypothetical protein
MSTVNHHGVRSRIRSQGPVGRRFFHIPTARFKERKRTKKKETAAYDRKFSLSSSTPVPNTYKGRGLAPLLLEVARNLSDAAEGFLIEKWNLAWSG